MAISYKFGPFRLDASAEILFNGSDPTGLGRRAVALLRQLLDRAGEPVSKEALIDAAWPGLAVEDSNLAVQIAGLRRVFDEIAGGAAWIETMPRRGYRFVGPSVTFENLSAEAAQEIPLGLAPSERASVAVLPFLNLNDDSQQDYFADGIAEDIITALSRFKSLLVIARNSSFSYKGKAADIKLIGQQLGVRYVVEGSVRRTGKQLRVTVQLLDATSGYHLWAERYDRELEDIFDVQDEIVQAIVSALPGRLEEAGRDLAGRKHTANITAYEFVLLGNERWRRAVGKQFAEARECFQSAVALDPKYARAYANIAWTRVCEVFLEIRDATALDDAMHDIEIALDIDDGDAWSHGVFGQLLFLRHDDERSEIHFNRALALNPNDADVAAVFANILVYWGRWQEALALINAAKRLNPFPPNLYHWYHALALYSGREYKQAIKTLKEARSPDRWAHGLLAACYAQIGVLDEALSELDAFVKARHRELRENGSPLPMNDLELAQTRANRYRHSKDREHFLDCLRKAGLGVESE